MIHLNTHIYSFQTHRLSKRNEDVNEVDDSFEHTLTKEKWRCKWSRWFIWTHIYQGEIEQDLCKWNGVDDSFEHTFIKEKWRCKWSRWFIWTHTYQREMKM